MSEIVKIKDLTFHYPENHRGLNSINLSIQPGEAVFIRGTSGCGKSTLARCLSGIIPHLYQGEYSGEVWVDGCKIEDEPLWKLSEKSGLVFQNPAMQILAPFVNEEILFGLENLGLSSEDAFNRMQTELQRFGLQRYEMTNPSRLSGGEQQKLSLASISARKPQVLILDEPLSMLDTRAAYEFLEFLNKMLFEGVTVIICEHRQEYLKQIPNLRIVDLNANGGTGIEKHTELTRVPENSVWNVAETKFELLVNDVTTMMGQRQLFDRASFSLENGQIVAVVGRNGTGKTTLLRCLSGFQPFEGRVSVRDNGSDDEPMFGMVFQNPDMQLFNATVRDEILYRHDKPDMAWYEWLINILNLEKYQDSPPLMLSEGEKRRVALATILMHKPRHGILLDEPALGQDRYHKDLLMHLLQELARKGYLLLFSTHDLEFASKADKILMLNPEGQIRVADSNGLDVQDNENWEYLDLVCPEWLK